jgi:hypothetical protein
MPVSGQIVVCEGRYTYKWLGPEPLQVRDIVRVSLSSFAQSIGMADDERRVTSLQSDYDGEFGYERVLELIRHDPDWRPAPKRVWIKNISLNSHPRRERLLDAWREATHGVGLGHPNKKQSRAVACPRCEVGPGALCVNLDGSPRAGEANHSERAKAFKEWASQTQPSWQPYGEESIGHYEDLPE